MVHYIKVKFSNLKEDGEEEDLMRGGYEFQSELTRKQRKTGIVEVRGERITLFVGW